MKRRKVFWLGNNMSRVAVFSVKPKDYLDSMGMWLDTEIYKFCRDDFAKSMRNTGLKLPRKNSKQLIPFHIVPAKGGK